MLERAKEWFDIFLKLLALVFLLPGIALVYGASFIEKRYSAAREKKHKNVYGSEESDGYYSGDDNLPDCGGAEVKFEMQVQSEESFAKTKGKSQDESEAEVDMEPGAKSGADLEAENRRNRITVLKIIGFLIALPGFILLMIAFK